MIDLCQISNHSSFIRIFLLLNDVRLIEIKKNKPYRDVSHSNYMIDSYFIIFFCNDDHSLFVERFALLNMSFVLNRTLVPVVSVSVDRIHGLFFLERFFVFQLATIFTTSVCHCDT